jgi:hypothetical protein
LADRERSRTTSTASRSSPLASWTGWASSWRGRGMKASHARVPAWSALDCSS